MTSACADATAATVADALSASTKNIPAQPSVVFRQTQRLYCHQIQEEIVLYSNGKCLVKAQSSYEGYEGTYQVVDEGRKIVISLSGKNLYCNVSIKNGSIAWLECNGCRYLPR